MSRNNQKQGYRVMPSALSGSQLLGAATFHNVFRRSRRAFTGLSNAQPSKGWSPTPFVTETVVWSTSAWILQSSLTVILGRWLAYL